MGSAGDNCTHTSTPPAAAALKHSMVEGDVDSPAGPLQVSG